MPKLIITFAVNVTMSVSKDRAFVKLFGNKAHAPVPNSSMLLWAFRLEC